MAERASTPSSICLLDPHGRDEAVAQEGAQDSIKKEVHFGTHRSRVSVQVSHEALTLHSPSLTLAHSSREVRGVKSGLVWVSVVSPGQILVLFTCQENRNLPPAHSSLGQG
jgi:hypothetical protein